MPDYKQLCVELVNELHGYKVAHPNHDTDLIDRARAALAEPEPEGPTPPPELVAQIRSDALHRSDGQLDYELRLIHAGYCAGADQELEACREEIIDGAGRLYVDDSKLRVCLADDIWTARRPKPPSLKEQALEVLKRLPIDPEARYCPSELDTIRRALEALPG